MVQLYSLMWIIATFFAVIGFLRGWNRGIITTAGIFMGMFALFQFDPFFRAVLQLFAFPSSQAFIIQVAIFLIIVYFAYQNTSILGDEGERADNLQDSILGIVIGFLNGYLIGGTLWYLMDIHEYPLNPFIIAPAPNSPSANLLNAMPLVLLSGGPSGSGEFLLVAVVVLLLIAFIVL